MGEMLRRNGYRTFGTGKWHNGRESFNRSFCEGDEIFFGGMADHWNVPAYHYDPSGKYAAVRPWIENWQLDNGLKYRRCDHIHAGKHSSELLADAALEFLKTGTGAGPFLLYLSFLAPHDPRSMPAEYRAMYDPAAIDLPPNFMAGHPFDTGALRIRDELLAGFPRNPAEIRRHIAEYYAMITHLDTQVGRVLAAVEEKGLTDNTIFVFAGDNGLALGQHGLMGKQNCYEHSVRVPLIFAGPGIPRGRRTEAYAYLFDVFPTLCELAGIETPESVEGTSLTSVFHAPDTPVRDFLYFAYTDTQRAIKDRRFKLIETAVDGAPVVTRLFDLESDPWEQNNLAEEPACRETLTALRREMIRLRNEWDDSQPEWGERFWKRMNAG
jgi:arylsulfatase A-like enzyme